MFSEVHKVARDVRLCQPKIEKDVYRYTYDIHVSTLDYDASKNNRFEIEIGDRLQPFKERLYVIKDDLIKREIYKHLELEELIQIRNIINEILSERKA